jgi:hypothetical protein
MDSETPLVKELDDVKSRWAARHRLHHKTNHDALYNYDTHVAPILSQIAKMGNNSTIGTENISSISNTINKNTTTDPNCPWIMQSVPDLLPQVLHQPSEVNSNEYKYNYYCNKEETPPQSNCDEIRSNSKSNIKNKSVVTCEAVFESLCWYRNYRFAECK